MASYTGTINTNEEWKPVSELTQFTFETGKTYKMQIQNSACLKIGKAVFNYNNEKFDYKATGSNLFVKTGYFPCILTILEDGAIEPDDVQPTSEKGSFDKATQTLTLKNAYIVGLINQVTDESSRASALQLIGDKDAIFDLNDVQLFPGTDKYFCFAKNITMEDGSPVYSIISMSGGDYSAIVSQVFGCLNEEGFSITGQKLEQLKEMGYGVDENAFTITGTKGNYDVVFNEPTPIPTPVSTKGSFDKATQTLTLKNSYVLEKCREIWSGESMTYFESVLGEKDVQIDTSNTTTYEGQGEFNVVSPEGFLLFSMITTAGTYSLAGSGGDGLFICTKEYPKYSSLTVLDEDFIVVTGTKGNYDVTLN